MKVLFVCSGNSLFGIAPFIKYQAASLEEKGLQLELYLIKNNGLLGYLKNIYPLRNCIKNNNYDIIHAHYSLCAWIAKLTLIKVPIIASFMGSDSYGSFTSKGKRKFSGILLMLITILVQPFISSIIIKSKSQLKYILSGRKTVIIPNGVNFNSFKPMDKEDCRNLLNLDHSMKYVLFLGKTKSNRKNFQLAKAAINLINNEEVILLAPFPVSPEKINLYLNAVDVFVLTSYREGSPNVIKEAMACNLPIVSTDVGDVKEIIGMTEGCYIADFNSRSFAEKISCAIKHEGRTNGRVNINYLEDNIVASKIIQVYEKTLLQGKTV